MKWLRKFMQGRYGMDQLSSAMVFLALILSLIANIYRLNMVYIFSTIILIISYYRVFSRDINKRYIENNKFLKLVNPITKKIGLLKRKFKTRKDFKYFKCSKCNQEVRVPKNKGKINITCPKCDNKMIRRT